MQNIQSSAAAGSSASSVFPSSSSSAAATVRHSQRMVFGGATQPTNPMPRSMVTSMGQQRPYSSVFCIIDPVIKYHNAVPPIDLTETNIPWYGNWLIKQKLMFGIEN